MAATALFDFGAELYAAYTDNPAWRESCAALAAFFPPGARRALDLGCGPGTTIEALAGVAPGVTWLGGDWARRMLRLAQNRLRGAGVRAALTRLDARTLPFANHCVDVVVGHSFLYLVADGRAVLREARRVVRPGGRVAFMEPAEDYVSPAGIWRVSADPRFLLSIPPWRVMSRLHRRYSAATFAADFQAAGFDDIRCSPALGGLGIIGSARRPP